jgi:nickel/cobalt transporter (NiCoT) family protein
VGGLLAHRIGPYVPWLLMLLGAINLWGMRKPITHRPCGLFRIARTSPFLVGILFGAGFETASQLSALVLASHINPWIVGGMFALGMILVDGTDGYLASRTQTRAALGNQRALRASRALGIFVVVFSLGLGSAELLKLELDRIALPLGCVLFVYLVVLRIWTGRISFQMLVRPVRSLPSDRLGSRKVVARTTPFCSPFARITGRKGVQEWRQCAALSVKRKH